MITSVRGRVLGLAPDGAVIEVGGVGLFLACTPTTLAGLRVGEQGRLATALVVREDSLTLYGFADDDERVVFELLQTAGGVGPRLAQAVLAVHPPNAVRRAVALEDLTALMLVPGIGRKGAQRIVLELKDRLGAESGAGGPAPLAGTSGPWRDQLRTALTGLGWSIREAEEAVAAVASEAQAGMVPEAQAGMAPEALGGMTPEALGEAPDIRVLLKSALRLLSRSS